MNAFHNFNTPRSVYLHIPFCFRRCFYCDFPIVPLGDGASGLQGKGSSSIKSYLSLLHREIALSPPGAALSTIYIGGGTPSLLDPSQIESLLAHLKKKFGIQQGAEITLEMDPATFNKQDLKGFIASGINRISLGGQSFNNKLLKSIGRTHTKDQLLEACEWLNNEKENGGLFSWSLDLIQNLPSQSLESWRQELRQAITTMAPHLSIYDLSIEAGTVFARRQARGDLSLPNEDLAADAMDITNLILSNRNFSRYEISNYALPGHVSRHNRVYWSGAGWWGFGQGATSAPWGCRLERPRTRDGYKKWIEYQEKEGIDSSLLQTKTTKLSLEDVILVGLRCREGVNLEEKGKIFGWNEEQCCKYFSLLKVRLKNAMKNGLITHSGKRMKLTNPKGMSISNQVFLELINWWDSLPTDAVHQPTL